MIAVVVTAGKAVLSVFTEQPAQGDRFDLFSQDTAPFGKAHFGLRGYLAADGVQHGNAVFWIRLIEIIPQNRVIGVGANDSDFFQVFGE